MTDCGRQTAELENSTKANVDSVLGTAGDSIETPNKTARSAMDTNSADWVGF
jgi:hypothetical protein